MIYSFVTFLRKKIEMWYDIVLLQTYLVLVFNLVFWIYSPNRMHMEFGAIGHMYTLKPVTLANEKYVIHSGLPDQIK